MEYKKQIMPKKILIIGGTSLVGSTLIDYTSKDYEIFVTEHDIPFTESNITCEKIDLLEDRNKIIQYISKVKPAAVIHTVAFSSVDFCESNHELANLLHVEITKDIKFFDRAYIIADRICNDLTLKTNGYVWEHYNENWEIDWLYNINDKKNLFRPYGFVHCQPMIPRSHGIEGVTEVLKISKEILPEHFTHLTNFMFFSCNYVYHL